MSPGPVRWQLLTREGFSERARDSAVVIVPTGSTEQHGPHLPVDTDVYTAEAIAVRAAERAPFAVLVAPAVAWGVSEYWMGFPGTIAVASHTLELLLMDICRSIARQGFPRIVLLNGHAGNTGVLQNVAVGLAPGGVKVAGLNYWLLVEDEIRTAARVDTGLIGHAGEVETSLQLALRPEAVAPVPDAMTVARSAALESAFASLAITAPQPADESPSGVYGDPRAATPELGVRLLKAATERLVEFLAAFRELPLPQATETER